jgi:hypothetical protein
LRVGASPLGVGSMVVVTAIVIDSPLSLRSSGDGAESARGPPS